MLDSTDETAAAAAAATRELLDHVRRSPGRQCFMLLDPVLRPVDAEDGPWQHHAGLPSAAVPVMHDRIDATSYPMLTALLPDTEPAMALLHHSVREAFDELTPASLQRGHGRRLGGWLASSAALEHVALHLGRIMVQRHSAGRTVWLRLHDPAVLWIVWGWLQPAQRAALLGPIDCIHVLSPAGQLQHLETSEPAVGDMDLTPAQWAAIDCIEPLNAALRDWGGLTRQPDQLRSARGAALAAIQRARRLGFEDARDLAFYGGCALSVHARFDFHSLVIDRLRARKPGDYFGGLVADLGARDWERIAREAPAANAT